MSPSRFAKPFLLKNDFKNYLKRNFKFVILAFVSAILGAALGILIACKIGERIAPFSVFARLFRLSYAPFSYVFSYLLRFFLYLLIASFGFFLPFSAVYPLIALFLYGKFIAQNVAAVFLTDSILSSVLSLVLIDLPLFLLGVFLLAFLYEKVCDLKICYGAPFNAKSISEFLLFILKMSAIYFAALILLFVVVCGVFYLCVVAL